jgi:hypothetical protein
MDELKARLAEKAGIDGAVAENAIGAVLGFLRDERSDGKAQTLIDGIPGAEAAIDTSRKSCGINSLMGGGLMALGTRLTALGLGMADIQNIVRELLRYGRDKIGSDQMNAITAEIPVLGQFA